MHVLVGDVKHRISKRMVSSRHGPGQLPAHSCCWPIQHHRGRSCKQSWVLLLPDKNMTTGQDQHVAEAVVILCTRRVKSSRVGWPKSPQGPRSGAQPRPASNPPRFRHVNFLQIRKHVASSPIRGVSSATPSVGAVPWSDTPSGLNVEVGRQFDHRGRRWPACMVWPHAMYPAPSCLTFTSSKSPVPDGRQRQGLDHMPPESTRGFKR